MKVEDTCMKQKLKGLLIIAAISFVGVILLIGIGIYLCPDRTFMGIWTFLYEYYKVYFYLIITLATNMICFMWMKINGNICVETVYKTTACLASVCIAYFICNSEALDSIIVKMPRHGYSIRIILGLIMSMLTAAGITGLLFLAVRSYGRIVEYVRKIQYELLFFFFLVGKMLLNNPRSIRGWVAAWYAMDYGNMGFGSRLLPGSILSLLLRHDYVDQKEAYFFIWCTLLLCFVLVSCLFAQCIKKCSEDSKRAVIYVILVYLASPMSIEYLMKSRGRLELFVSVFILLFVIGYRGIQNPVLKCTYGCIMSFAYMACHQGGFFLFFPIIFTVLVMDMLESKYKKCTFFSAMTVIAANGISFLIFQFFTQIKYGSLEELISMLEAHTNLEISSGALNWEYFAQVQDAYHTINIPFLTGEEFPRETTFLLIVVLIPMLIMFVGVWIKAYRTGRKQVYIWLLLSDLAIIPQFVLNVDWGRWWSAIVGVQTFQILYLTYNQDAGMKNAMQGLAGFVKKHCVICMLILIYLASFDKLYERGYSGIVDEIFNILKTHSLSY